MFSFKLRGAYNKIAQAPRAMIERGVICSSAGNHAQGVALAARKHGLDATIVMPTTASPIKVEAVAALGGEVVLEGLTYDDATRFALELAAKTGRAFVHPFDDPDVIAGQGTIALELERQWRDRPPAAIFVPVGGGGLIGGIGAYVKERYPEVRIVGVEPFESASMAKSLYAGTPRDARPRRHVRRRRRGAARRRRGVPARARGRRRGRAREHGRDLRRDQGHLRGQPRGRRARRRARRRGLEALARAEPGPRRDADRDQQRRELELRQAAPRDRARRDRRASRGADRGRDPGAARRVPRVLRGARAAQRDRVQLPLRGAARPRGSSSACRSRAARKRPAS